MKWEMKVRANDLACAWLPDQAARTEYQKVIFAFPFGLIATDGYVMVRVADWKQKLVDPNLVAGKPVAIDVDDAKIAAELIKKWKIGDADVYYSPEDNTVAFKNYATGQTYSCKAETSGIPNFDRVLPEGDPQATLNIPVRSLLRMAKTLEKMGIDEGHITLRWYGTGKQLTASMRYEDRIIEFLCMTGPDSENFWMRMEKWFEAAAKPAEPVAEPTDVDAPQAEGGEN